MCLNTFSMDVPIISHASMLNFNNLGFNLRTPLKAFPHPSPCSDTILPTQRHILYLEIRNVNTHDKYLSRHFFFCCLLNPPASHVVRSCSLFLAASICWELINTLPCLFVLCALRLSTTHFLLLFPLICRMFSEYSLWTILKLGFFISIKFSSFYAFVVVVVVVHDDATRFHADAQVLRFTCE